MDRNKFVVRPIALKMLPDLIDLANQAQLGMTNLPKNEKKLKEMIETSILSFQDENTTPKNHFYLFALLEMPQEKVVGVSGICGLTGFSRPLEYLKREGKLLNKVKYVKGPSEICSLFVTRDVRKTGGGKLISLSRFFYIANFYKKFTDTIFADLRGITDREGNCPFWDHFGRHFLNISFSELMHKRDFDELQNFDFIPSAPIYFDLLNEEAKNSLGKTHPNTAAALTILKEQGFIETNEFDPFDGGPRVIAKKENIKTIQDSKTATVSKIQEITGMPYLLANTKNEFSSCFGSISVDRNNEAAIDKESAKLLNIEIGDLIRYAIV